MTNPVAKRFAANLQTLRKSTGMSQEEIAFRAGMHRTQISLLEGGDRMPRVETLVKLAGALEATPNDLLAGISFRPLAVVVGGFEIDASGAES